MSKKNRKYSAKKNNGYPLPKKERAVEVLYSRKKHMQPVPEVGRQYHCFDDGKITMSRHYTVDVREILGQMQFRKKYPELFNVWLDESKNTYWLFARTTDKFIVTVPNEDRNGDYMTEVFVRTKRGGWFSFTGNSLYCGRLDIDGKLLASINLDVPEE